MQSKWCVGMVAYHSDVYIKWQLKILYEFNNPQDFELIIVDNSNPNQKKELESLTAPYQAKYKNIKLIYHSPKFKKASEQHAEGLNIIKDKANSKYLLVQDPDFFYVQKNYLNLFEKYLLKGNISIGAPYPSLVGNGAGDFPCAFGCAMPTSIFENKEIDFLADASRWEESLKRFPGKDFSFDVGYKIREKHSNEPYISFSQEKIGYLAEILGSHSYEVITREYFFNNKTIAFHLFRGNFTGEVTKNQEDPKKDIEDRLYKTRNSYGKLFYHYIKNDKLTLTLKQRLIINKHIIISNIKLCLKLIIVFPIKKVRWVLKKWGLVKKI